MCTYRALVSPCIVIAQYLVYISHPRLNPTLMLSSYSMPLSKLFNLIKIMTTIFKNCFVDLKKMLM